ncbi:MAG: hypothetical protein ACYCXA_05290 [Actinomycetes bacterium]
MVLADRSARREINATHARADAVRLVTGQGCPACRYRDDAVGHWVSAFVNESHTEPDVIGGVIRAGGGCARHLRRLATDDSAAWLMGNVLDPVARGVLSGRVVAGSARACPLCRQEQVATGRLLALLDRMLGSSEVLAAYREGGGLCLAHTVELVDLARPRVAVLVAELAVERLAATDPDDPSRGFDLLTGVDQDADRRARLGAAAERLASTEAEQLTGTDPLGVLQADLDVPACPLCRARARGEWRYLAWLRRPEGPARPVEEDAVLCSAHHHDLVTSHDGVPGSGWVTTVTARRHEGLLAGFARSTATLPRDPWRSSRRQRSALARLHLAPGCRACRAGRTAVARTGALLCLAVDDASIAKRYATCQGVCARCAADWATTVGGGTPPAVADRMRAVLGLVGFDLAELNRKTSWTVRYEPKGVEMGSWRPALAVLDGQVLGGLGVREAVEQGFWQ